MATSDSTRRPDQIHRSAVRAAHKGDPAWEARWAWERIKDRIIYKRGGRNKCYEAVEIRMTRDEFLAWATPAYAEWISANPGRTPSIDRIRPDGHYELGNLQIIEHGENARRSGHLKNLSAPDGTAWCCGCKEYLPKDLFYAQPRYAHGTSSECRECCGARSSRRYRQQKAGRQQRETKERLIYVGGVEMSVTKAAELAGIPRHVIYLRLNAGWEAERAISTPVQPRQTRTT